jgi:hypothetical protein
MSHLLSSDTAVSMRVVGMTRGSKYLSRRIWLWHVGSGTTIGCWYVIERMETTEVAKDSIRLWQNLPSLKPNKIGHEYRRLSKATPAYMQTT